MVDPLHHRIPSRLHLGTFCTMVWTQIWSKRIFKCYEEDVLLLWEAIKGSTQEIGLKQGLMNEKSLNYHTKQQTNKQYHFRLIIKQTNKQYHFRSIIKQTILIHLLQHSTCTVCLLQSTYWTTVEWSSD